MRVRVGRLVGGAFACVCVLAACSSPAAVVRDGPNATVVRVIDGDTIDVDISGSTERVRLLGIDTPEIAHPAGDDRPATPGECFGVEATDFTSALLQPGSEVRLERDIVGRDHYGRILAHVIRIDGVYVNYEIVRHGLARPLTIEPNVANREVIVDAATAAEADSVGLWAACD